MCIDELEAGRKPYCVMACMMRVLDIGPIEEIWQGVLKSKAIGPNDKTHPGRSGTWPTRN